MGGKEITTLPGKFMAFGITWQELKMMYSQQNSWILSFLDKT